MRISDWSSDVCSSDLAGLAALALLHLGQLLAQQVVDHRRGQDLVLAADGEPDLVFDAMAQRLGVAAEGRDEAARGQLEAADGLERALGAVVVEVGQGEGGGDAEKGEAYEEHWLSGDGKRWGQAK